MFLDQASISKMSMGVHVQAKMSVAFGNLDAFSRWMGMDHSTDFHALGTLPHGGYSLLRSTLESAGEVLWILDSDLRKTRLRRLMMSAADEVINASRYFKSRGIDRTEEMAAKAEQYKAYSSGLGQCWSPFKVTTDGGLASKVSVSNFLNEIRHRNQMPADNFPSWESTWRACSGAAHGQMWAILMLSEREDIGQRNADNSQTAHLYASYQRLAFTLVSTVELVACAYLRYFELASAPASSTGSVRGANR